jgi:hypothetical protein
MDKSMTERLEYLENQNGRFKWVGILFIVIVASIAFMGQATPITREIRAQKFSLYDSTGKNRGMLFTSAEGQAILVLADRSGEPRMTLTVAGDGTPGIGLMDKGDKVRAEFSISKESPRLAFYSKEERERLLLHIGADGQPRIGLMDANKSPRVVIGASGEQWAVAVFDSKGNVLGGVGEKK